MDRRHSSPGFPHSGIPGSRPACGSPRLIAARYALRRLLMPGHPPLTLSSLTSDCAPDTPGLSRPIPRHFVKEHWRTPRFTQLNHVSTWWSWAELNRRPSACKADALPTELQPRTDVRRFQNQPRRVTVVTRTQMVGLGRIELPTSRLSGVRSSHLSYRPKPIPRKPARGDDCLLPHRPSKEFSFPGSRKLTLTSSDFNVY